MATADILEAMKMRLRRFWPHGRQLLEAQRTAFLQSVRAEASQQGYAVIEVGNELIELLLCKRQTRVVVMNISRRNEASLAMDLSEADSAWIMGRSSGEPSILVMPRRGASAH